METNGEWLQKLKFLPAVRLTKVVYNFFLMEYVNMSPSHVFTENNKNTYMFTAFSGACSTILVTFSSPMCL